MICTDIVIVDSGVTPEQSTTYKIPGIGFKQTDDKIIKAENYNDVLGHGTAICNVIKSHCKEVNIYMIKIIEEEYASEQLLLFALQFILKNINCKIVNLSLGINALKERDKMFEVCEKLLKRGTFIVAAFGNDGTITFPAAFDNVIGVCCSNDDLENNEFEIVDNSVITILAKGQKQRVIGRSGVACIEAGNSIACAHFSGILFNILYENKRIVSFENLMECLREKAIKNILLEKAEHDNDRFILGKTACLFPFNKEMHSLIRFKHLLSFRIVDVYDSKYSAKIGATTNDLLKISHSDTYVIKALEQIDYDSFDMIIIGHCAEYLRVESQRKAIHSTLLNCIKMNKKIYSFDALSTYEISCNFNKNIFVPQIKERNIQNNTLGMLYKFKEPILGVFGTSSQQGKFTLQLILREKFLNDNYKVGQLGTEPSAILYGMDECYHFGYNAQSLMRADQAIMYINGLLQNISLKNPDVIMVGSQSNILPSEFGHINGYAIKQIQFLLATNPDVVIFCINEFDELNVIERSIKLIEASVDCSVIALVVFPITFNYEHGNNFKRMQMSKTQFQILKKKIEENFHKPTYLLGNKTDMDELYNQVLQVFS